MPLLTKPAIPQDQIAVEGGAFVPAYKHFFNALVRMGDGLSKAASITASAQSAVSASYTRAGANYTTGEITTALDEIKTDIADLSTAIQGVQTTLNQAIAALKTAGLMET